jgi:hypothetical protein
MRLAHPTADFGVPQWSKERTGSTPRHLAASSFKSGARNGKPSLFITQMTVVDVNLASRLP